MEELIDIFGWMVDTLLWTVFMGFEAVVIVNAFIDFIKWMIRN